MGFISGAHLAAGSVHGFLRGGDGVHRRHETLLDAELIVDDLGQWSQAVSGARSVAEKHNIQPQSHPPLAGPRNFRNEALPHIALIFCILRTLSDWTRTLSMRPNIDRFLKHLQLSMTLVLLFIIA